MKNPTFFIILRYSYIT